MYTLYSLTGVCGDLQRQLSLLLLLLNKRMDGKHAASAEISLLISSARLHGWKVSMYAAGERGRSDFHECT